MKRLSIPVLVISTVLALQLAHAESDAAEDKCRYTLFNPTPREQMREWRTDHAGTSPFTVDAGHFEIQVDLFSYAYAEFPVGIAIPGGTVNLHQEIWNSGATVLKAGLLNSLDLEFGMDGYSWVRERYFVGLVQFRNLTADGFGDISTRLKWNLWGNDSGKTALSLSGVVIFPTSSDNFPDRGYRGGPALEFWSELPCEFELRVDSQAILYDTGRDIQAQLINLASVSHQLVGELSGYVMFASYSYTFDPDWRGYVKTGLNYRIAKNVELYAGSWFGVHGPASDYSPFVGIGARF